MGKSRRHAQTNTASTTDTEDCQPPAAWRGTDEEMGRRQVQTPADTCPADKWVQIDNKGDLASLSGEGRKRKSDEGRRRPTQRAQTDTKGCPSCEVLRRRCRQKAGAD